MLKFHSNKQKKDDGVGDMATHHFQVELAKEYGLVPAILLENIYFWVEKNRANEQHFHDGRYWTYNSMKAYTELFPYMGEKQVRNALKKLKDDGLIVVGNFNKSAYDQTKWYALTEKGIQAVEKKGQTPFAQKANGEGERTNRKGERTNRKGERTNVICPNAEPIPDNKTQIINTDNKTQIINTDDKTDIDVFDKSNTYVTLSGDDLYTRVRDAWNTLSDLGIKPVRGIEGKRKESVRARIKQYSEESFMTAIANIRASDFLQGKGKKGWVITFDWFIKPNNFPKVLEGNYENRSGQSKADINSSRESQLEYLLNSIREDMENEQERSENNYNVYDDNVP